MDDAEIVRLYWARDNRAIPATAEKYGSYCTVIAQNILGNREDAEECVNDAWLQAWKSIPPHRPETLRTYLGKITRNLALNRLEYNTAQKRGGGQSTAVLDEIAAFVPCTDTAEQALTAQALTETIDEFLAALTSEQRSMFLCRYWYFDSIADIASRRLRQKLRRHLEERGFEP